MWTIQMHDHSTPHNARVWKVASFVWLLKHVNWSVMQKIRGWCLRFLSGSGVFAGSEEERRSSQGNEAIDGGVECRDQKEGEGRVGGEGEGGEAASAGEKGKEEEAADEEGEAQRDTAMKVVEPPPTADVYTLIAASTRPSLPHTTPGAPPALKPAPQASNFSPTTPPPRPSNGMREKKMKLNAFHFSYAA
jgi:hypothetical protein